MNILFLTLGTINSLEAHSIYCDLLREFVKHGHSVFTLSPGKDEVLQSSIGEARVVISHIGIDTVRGGRNLIKKGLSTLNTSHSFIRGINKYYSDVRFDLVMYSTPPITFCKAVEYVKKRDGAKSYLLLKDIFPQNALDLGMMSKNGIRSILPKYFRAVEKRLYRVSNYIGCMSEANVQYLLKHNPEIEPDRVEECPNSIEVMDQSVSPEIKAKIREKYGIPQDKTVFVYGGNLGKPQGIPFILECLKRAEGMKDAFFLIIGSGSEYGKLESFVLRDKPENVRLLSLLPRDEYDSMVGSCDVGLIFLDHRFTIPNFPSRLLSYMQAKLPVLACTDPNTDIGKVIVDGGFGWWCESNDANRFANCIGQICSADLEEMKERAFQYLQEHYSVQGAYATVMKRCNK